LCSTCAEFFETLEHQRLDLLNRTAVNKQTVIRFAAQHSIAWHFFPDWLRQIELQFGPVSTRMRAENLTECVNSFTEQEVNFLLAYDVVDAAFSHGFTAEVESLVVG
jgi:DNA-binding transcriptional LysR family regulator